MLLRVSFLFLLLLCGTSCDKFSFAKSKQIQTLDTVINFSSVDIYPSFKVCDSIIDKEEKSNCFRTTIHKKIGSELQQHQFITKDSISEVVYVDLLINTKGEIILEALQSSNYIKQQLPQLDSVLRLSISNIPNVYPAIKRGIPVTTKYRLPIKIDLKQ